MSYTTTYYRNIQVHHSSRRIMLGEIDEAMQPAWDLTYQGDYYDIVAHGSPDHMHPILNGNRTELEALQVYAILCKHADYHDQPIRLVSCKVGYYPDGFAQQLANLAGVAVLAATAKILVQNNELRFYDPREHGEPVRPDDLGPKQWIVYQPQTNA